MGLLVLRWVAQLWLDRLNLANVKAHAAAVPAAFKNIMDEATYKKSVDYTLARGRIRAMELTYDFIVLLIVLLSGVLPRPTRHSPKHGGPPLGQKRPFCLLSLWPWLCPVCLSIGMNSSISRSALGSIPRLPGSGGWIESRASCLVSFWVIR